DGALAWSGLWSGVFSGNARAFRGFSWHARDRSKARARDVTQAEYFAIEALGAVRALASRSLMETSDIKKGVKIMMDGQPYIVVDFQFVKPGKGQAFTRTKMKNLLTGGVLERNIRSGEKLEAADVVDITMQYIYPDGEGYVFMNSHTG